MNTNRAGSIAFTFVTPPRLVVGWGAATDDRLVQETARLGKHPLIVVGSSLARNGTLALVQNNLERAGISVAVHEGVPPEPDLDALQSAIDVARATQADCVLAIGGGSVLDVAKGAAALSGSSATAQEYFDGKLPVPESGGLPILAVPTTAGTGSEATWVGVYVDKKTKRKASIRGTSMMPATALLDAQLTVSCPPSVTAYSGMDAFVQAIEAYTSVGANPLTNALAFEAAQLVASGLEAIHQENPTQTGYEQALLGSYMAGAALNTSRLGLVHGLAHPIGAITGAPHGLLCGLLMPSVLRFNREVAQARYASLAHALQLATPETSAMNATEVLLSYIEERLVEYKIPLRLSEIGLTEGDLDYVAREAMTSGSTKANPRPVTEADARAVTASCL